MRDRIEDYAVSAMQTFRRHPVNTFINIGGLAVGLAACLVIALHIQDELSFDLKFENHDRIVRVEQRLHLTGTDIPASPQLAMPASRDLDNFGTPIEAKTTIVHMPRIVRQGEEQNFETVAFAESNFFDVFDFSSMIDRPERALENPNSILISEDMAVRYFPGGRALGGVLTLNNDVDYEVIGVFPKLPRDIHFRFDFLVLFDEERDMPRTWRFNRTIATTYTYIEVAQGTDLESLETRIDSHLQDLAHQQWPRAGTVGFGYLLTPLADIHLYSESRFDMAPPGDIGVVITLAIIAGLILAIASINYVNLTTARAAERAREVSIRKTLGATRGQLIVQFLLESVVLTALALLVALALVWLVLPAFNGFLDKELALNLAGDPVRALLLGSVAVFVGLLGGLYPAFVLSSFRPARVLRSNQSAASGSTWLRNALVVLQYSVSFALILITVLIVRQTDFARHYDLGFDTSHKVNVDVSDPAAQPHISVLENEFRRIPGVAGLTMMKRAIPGGISYLWEMSIPEFSSGGGRRVANYEVDEDFFAVMDIEVIAGRAFSAEFQADRFVPPDQRNQNTAEQVFSIGSIVVNESLLDVFGIPDARAAIGARVFIEPQNIYRNVEAVIVGVVKDVHFDSVHNETRGGYFSLRVKEELGAMTLALETNDLAATMGEIDRVWGEVVPSVPVVRRFLDSAFNELYLEEERRGRLFSWFAGLAVVISCLGLYGLSSFTAIRRKKEISIRKVLGASVQDVVWLLLVQFTRPVLVSALIGLPVAGLFVNDWLSTFAYRIDLVDHLYLFPLALIGLLAVAWATVSLHAIQAARARPVESLRTE